LPHIENVRNPFDAERVRQLDVLIEQRIAVAHHQYIIATPDAVQEPGIFEAAADNRAALLQIGVLIVEAVEKARGISNAPDMETA
jgi:hypothetical protein